MVKCTAVYEGDLRCKITHGPSGQVIQTDAPVDNEGRGESFSPTDLFASSLGACMLTIMGIMARRHDIDIRGTHVEVRKIMSSTPPRRIARLEVDYHIPLPPDHPKRQLLENAALGCPVHHGLHPDIENVIQFHWEG